MTRPENPNWTTLTWATNDLHPAGANPWNGQVTKAAHPGPAGGFNPDQGAAAEYLNYLFNAVFSRGSDEKSKISQVLDYVGQLPAYNWVNDTTSIGDLEYAVYDGRGTWYAVGGANNGRATDTWGHDAWIPNGNLFSVAGAGEECLGGDCNTSGGVIFSTDTRYVFKIISGVVAKTDVFGSAITATASATAYSPSAALWCVMCTTAGSVLVRTSPTGVTWTNRTPPTNFVNGGLVRLAANKTTGRIVAANCDTAFLRIWFSRSDDGGITWSAGAYVTIASAGLNVLGLVHNPDANDGAGEWIMNTGVSGSTTEVWASPDGITWTQRCSLNASCINNNVAPFGSMLVGTAGTSIVRSLDGGATWMKTGIRLTGSARGVFAGGGGCLALTDTHAMLSLRVGDPGTVALA